MKITVLFIGSLIAFLLSVPVTAETKISEIEFVDSNFKDVIRTLSELSESNIIATPEASENDVTIHLKNVSVADAIKSISRISGLWYRFDNDTNTYRIMTREEYGNDIKIQESQHIEIFKLLNANVQIVAQAIEDLLGGRVKLSLGVEAGKSISTTSSSNNNSNSSNSNNRSSNNNSNRSSNSGGNSTVTGQELDIEDLSDDQFEQLNVLKQSGLLNAQTVQKLTLQAQPIYITVNNEHNMIIVRTDDRKVLKSIALLVKEMDIAIPQVMLEMKILNIVLGEDFNSIFNFELRPSGGNDSLNPIELGNNPLFNTGSFIYEFLNSRLRANIEFLEENNRIKVLSNPMVLASNHREAELFIGEETLLTRGFTYNPPVIENGIVISPSFIETETELEDIGITLKLTPKINSDRTVTIDLQQESSTINEGGATIPITDGNGGVVNLAIDTVNSSRLDGTVVAKDGLTVAVGGLIRNRKSQNEKKVPILSEIPVIGRIFRSTIETDQDTETVLLITPRILTTPDESEKIRKTDNQYYKSFNNDFPDPEPFPNKFIDKKEPQTTVNVETTTPTKAQPTSSNGSRQQLYFDMSKFASEMLRIPEAERLKNDLYKPVWVDRSSTDLFGDSRIKSIPVFSWNRGGLYITAVNLINTSNDTVPVHYQAVSGRWLASSIESSLLTPKDQVDSSTYLYLISATPFNDVVVAAN